MNVITFYGFQPGPRYDHVPWVTVRIDESADASGPWTPIDSIALDPVDADPSAPMVRNFTTDQATLDAGWYRIAFIDGDGEEQLVDPVPYPSAQLVLTEAGTNIRVLVPRVRRAVEGAGAAAVLSNDAVKDLVADSIASISLYTGSVFGKTLEVLAIDPDTGAPVEYATSSPLTLQEGTVVATQAALDYFFHQFASLKVSEKIADEAGSWEYALSASLLKGQMDLLVAERDRAIEAMYSELPLDTYVSFIAERDVQTARLIEPWVDGSGAVGGLLTAGGIVVEPDYRFGGLG